MAKSNHGRKRKPNGRFVKTITRSQENKLMKALRDIDEKTPVRKEVTAKAKKTLVEFGSSIAIYRRIRRTTYMPRDY